MQDEGHEKLRFLYDYTVDIMVVSNDLRLRFKRILREVGFDTGLSAR